VRRGRRLVCTHRRLRRRHDRNVRTHDRLVGTSGRHVVPTASVLSVCPSVCPPSPALPPDFGGKGGKRNGVLLLAPLPPEMGGKGPGWGRGMGGRPGGEREN
jgi:hypothetical protein